VRALVGVVVVMALCGAPRSTRACIQASEVSDLVGWSADGAYALFTRGDGKGGIEHAEIHPTSYAGFIYLIVPRDDGGGFAVSKTEVGSCPDFHDEDGYVVERGRGRLTLESLRALRSVAALKIGREEQPATAPLPSITFTGKKRHDVHDLELTSGQRKQVVPIPVWCVGSCLADEDFAKWSATLDAVHRLASGTPLYEVTLRGVCNGGTLHRLIAPTPPGVKVPKRRCRGSGQ
jgi:hypothetical protein